jgi:signal transduction histidine kinase
MLAMADNSREPTSGGRSFVEAKEPDAREQLDALRREIEELRASRRRLVLASDAERRRFERDLHDGLQQQLVGLAADLELAARSLGSDPTSAMSLIEEMRGEVQRALEQTRKLAHRIAPPLLEAGGLLVALRSAAASADVRSRIDVVGGAAFPPELASAVYYGFVDVLDRAKGGTSVAITVDEEDGALVFELTVDGEVDAEAFPLRDRIQALGGELTTGSGPGSRASWTGSLPLPR